MTSHGVPPVERLLLAGFSHQVVFDDDGEEDSVVYSRSWRGVRETVWLFAGQQALAYRLPVERARPDLLNLQVIYTDVLIPLGESGAVVDELLKTSTFPPADSL